MSGTTTPPAPAPRLGKIIISVIAQMTYLGALAITGWLALTKQDQVWVTSFVGLCGVAATNATNVIGYWIGSSAGSDHKTDMMAQGKP